MTEHHGQPYRSRALSSRNGPAHGHGNSDTLFRRANGRGEKVDTEHKLKTIKRGRQEVNLATSASHAHGKSRDSPIYGLRLRVSGLYWDVMRTYTESKPRRRSFTDEIVDGAYVHHGIDLPIIYGHMHIKRARSYLSLSLWFPEVAND